ncbi:hypothetical protein PG999_010913 [Apiospora kogelbergensis]|uniref:Carrier domain-containing protein n=1 Tax=Apiospora kogelbergensis TaxID=1337665 RepID=A0AAW0QE63_9PEZI
MSGGATCAEYGQHVDAPADAYLFGAKTGKMAMAAFGFRFARMPRTLMARMLKSKKSASPKKSAGATKCPELLQNRINVTNRPLSQLTGETTLDDLTVDLLMATEVLNDIRTVLGLTIDLTSILFFPNIQAMTAYVDGQLGLGVGG